jgi:hypothetical protein
MPSQQRRKSVSKSPERSASKGRSGSKELVGVPNHPAGDDPQAQHRWDTAMGHIKDDGDVKEELKAKRKEKKIEERLIAANGGLEDWVFSAGGLIYELIELLEEESFGLHDMLNACRDAARNLTDDQWKRFQEIPKQSVHTGDKDVLTSLFSAAEPQWRTLMTTPKKGGTCVFLTVGTEAPSTQILDLLTKLGWYGVAVSPEPPGEGNEDRVQHVELDPAKEADEEQLVKLQVAKGSLLPKPAQFMLAFADCMWDPDEISGGADQDTIFKRIDANGDCNVTKKEFKQAVKAGLIPKELKFKTLDINGDGTISKKNSCRQ